MTHSTYDSALAPPSVTPLSALPPYLAYPPYRPPAPQAYPLTPFSSRPSSLSYGQPPMQARESMAARGIPAPARRTRMHAWIVGLLAALVCGTGIGIVIVAQDDVPGTTDPPAQGAPGNPGNAEGPEGPAPEQRDVPSPPTDCLVECTEPLLTVRGYDVS